MYHSMLNMGDNRLILELLFNINICNKGLNIYTFHFIIPFYIDYILENLFRGLIPHFSTSVFMLNMGDNTSIEQAQ